MNTAEHKVLLYLQQNLEKPVLEYFNPLVFLKCSDFYLREEFLQQICEWYYEYALTLNLIDTYFLYCLSKEAEIENIVLNRLFDKKEVSKKLSFFFNLYDKEDFKSITGVEYYTRFPHGRVIYTLQ